MFPWYLLETTTATDAFSDMSKPIVGLIDSALTPVIAIVGALGAIYCVLLGVKLAKAGEPQDREKAKQALKNAIVGFLLIFILVVALKAGIGPLEDWMNDNSESTSSKSSTSSTSAVYSQIYEI